MASVPSLEDARCGSPVATGLVAEVDQAIVAHYAQIGRTADAHGPGSISAEPQVVRDIFVASLASAGVTLALHTDVAGVQRSGTTVTGVTLDNGMIVAPPVVIDASGLGAVLPPAGAGYRVGTQRSSQPIDPTACVQSITYVAPIRKYLAGMPPELAIATPPLGYAAVPSGPYLADASYGITTHDGFASLVVAN